MARFASRAAAGLLRVLPRKRLSRALGRLSALTLPPALLHPVISLYVRGTGVDLDEAEVPPGGFPSFDAFFTRRLRPGARPIDPDPRAVVSPADGVVADRGIVDPASRLSIKGADYAIAELLRGTPDAERFAGGEFVTVYLAPGNYHRVHAPAAGWATRVTHVPGTLYPVNAFGLSAFGSVFSKNERVAVWFTDVERGEGGTRWVVLFVAAIGVGHVTLDVAPVETNSRSGSGGDAPIRPPVAVRAGEEIGAFHLGSTVILFFEPGALRPSGPGPGEVVRVGERLGLR